MQVDENKQSSSGLEFKLHPLVLINVSDHHNRIRANTGASSSDAGGAGSSDGAAPRVMGCLLGHQQGRVVDVSNSFEIKYTDGDGGPVIDEAFLARKTEQYKQVFSQLEVVGWYTTGKGVAATDAAIHKRIMEMNEAPVLLLLDPSPDYTRRDLPVTLMESETQAGPDGPTMRFATAKYSLETSEAERIGVDQVAKILPGGKASGSDQLSAHLTSLHSAMKMLASRIAVVRQLVAGVATGQGATDHGLMRQVAALVASLPAVDTDDFKAEYASEYADTLLTILLSSVTKGAATANDVVDKYLTAYEKPRRTMRSAGMAHVA